ncbi:MAG: zinc ribbon domain-containing protein [Dehalococcoidia bacterium]|jgi:NAD-dependent SIR2 family protein deacetylase
MPIYQYYCEKCEKEFELKRLMADIDKPALCPKCKKQGTRLVTAFSSMVGLHLKTPSKAILRKPAVKKTAISRKTAQAKKHSRK